MVFTVSRVKGSKGSEVTPVEFPWGNPIQLGKEVGWDKYYAGMLG